MFTISMGISDGKTTIFAKSKSHKFYYDLCIGIICIAVMGCASEIFKKSESR